MKLLQFITLLTIGVASSGRSQSPAGAPDCDPAVATCLKFDAQSMGHLTEHLSRLPQAGVALESAGSFEKASSCVRPVQREEPKVSWWQKLNPIWWLGNANDPKAPHWYRPQNPLRNLLWYFRNPFHNFTFFVIGVADKQNSPEYQRCGEYPLDVFAPNPGWNYSYISYKNLRLPFVSYWNSKVKFYWGWRERGNFGVKINRVKNNRP